MVTNNGSRRWPNGRIPPHNLEAEASLLGALLLYPSALRDPEVKRLVPEQFYKPDHRAVFTAIHSLAGRGEPADITTVDAELQVIGVIGDPHAIVVDLAQSPATANAGRYAKIVRDCSYRRQAIQLGSDIQAAAYNDPEPSAVARVVRDGLARLEASRHERDDRVVNGADVLDLPAPTALVEDVLCYPSVVMLYGPPKIGKSLLAIDLALSVATGHWWQGRATIRGPVFYVAAEGVGGLGTRVAAWLHHHGVDRDELGSLTWLTRAVNLADSSAVERVAILVDNLRSSLIVIDTLARCMVGADENTARDMGNVVAALDRLRDICGSCVVVVHHMGKDRSAGARGSNALLGAVDTAVELTGDPEAVRVKVEAQKDAPCVQPWWCTTLSTVQSVVIVPAPRTDEMTDVTRAVLAALAAAATPDGLSSSAWLKRRFGSERGVGYPRCAAQGL